MTRRRLLLIPSLVLLALLAVAFSACRGGAQANISKIELSSVDNYTDGIDIPLPLVDREEQLLYRKAYIVSYNKQTLQPNWVAWHLTREHTYGDVPRPGAAWHDDSEVPQPRVYHRDYSGTVWDRGHMCPAGDNKWDSVAMYESFLLTNSCPQSKALNSGIWNQIEMSCRDWARRYGDIYIVCGPLFLNQERDTIGQHRIPVPNAFFKVVADLNPEHPKGIGFICRNNEGTRKRDLYTNTISEVERITGITFFPNLADDIKSIVKDSADISRW